MLSIESFLKYIKYLLFWLASETDALFHALKSNLFSVGKNKGLLGTSEKKVKQEHGLNSKIWVTIYPELCCYRNQGILPTRQLRSQEYVRQLRRQKKKNPNRPKNRKSTEQQ